MEIVGWYRIQPFRRAHPASGQHLTRSRRVGGHGHRAHRVALSVGGVGHGYPVVDALQVIIRARQLNFRITAAVWFLREHLHPRRDAGRDPHDRVGVGRHPSVAHPPDDCAGDISAELHNRPVGH